MTGGGSGSINTNGRDAGVSYGVAKFGLGFGANIAAGVNQTVTLATPTLREMYNDFKTIW